METERREPANEKNIDLIHLAEHALPLVDRDNKRPKDRNDSLQNENTRPARPKILTRTSGRQAKRLTKPGDGHRQYGHSSPPSRSISPKKDDPASVAISPMLRRFTIPNSERSPTETLPAMQRSPQSCSSKSPNGQHSLPSLRAIQLEPLLDSRSPNENAPHGGTRPRFPLGGNGSATSPSMSSVAPRPAQYPSPQTRMNGPFHQPYPHGQPSPAYSEASPRDSNMSPPDKPPPHQFYSAGRTPQSEELTPQSAESHLSSGSFSTASSPHPAHLMDLDRSRPTLPPLAGLPGGSLITGAFKCEHAGCTAPAFQTQYLLK